MKTVNNFMSEIAFQSHILKEQDSKKNNTLPTLVLR